MSKIVPDNLDDIFSHFSKSRLPLIPQDTMKQIRLFRVCSNARVESLHTLQKIQFHSNKNLLHFVQIKIYRIYRAAISCAGKPLDCGP